MTRIYSSLRRAVHRVRRSTVRLVEQRYLGASTEVDIWPKELGYEYGMYRGSPWLVLREVFRSLEVAEDDVFVDVGSGMGRVVLMAARRPFRRVIGIERSGQLNRVAQGIIDRHRHRLACQDIELLSVDVLDWNVPDDLTVVYLFCPFPEFVFDQLVERLLASIDRSPRPMRLIYDFSTARDRDILTSTGRAQRISFRVPWYLRSRFEELSIYRLLPSGWGAPGSG
jgi:SAM-dependent methyltransferase